MKAKPSIWEVILNSDEKDLPKEWPKISIIIPTINSASLIPLTLDHVLNQNYKNFEVIIVDCSTDNTLEIIKGYRNQRVQIFSTDDSARYAMINKGLSHATGNYVSILFPGDFYLYHETLHQMMMLAKDNDWPDLVYCGTLLKDPKSEVKVLFRELTLELLKRGQQPTSLQGCWFKNEIFGRIGKFNQSYRLRGGYEFLCRFILNKDSKFASINRVLMDYDLRTVTRTMVLIHFWETMKTIHHYFGLYSTLKWLIYQKEISRYIRLWWRSLKMAFFGS